MDDPRTGRTWQIGTDTVPSPHPNLIFRKGPVKAEIAGEWIQSKGGRKVRGYYGRDADGQWRGQAQDIGDVNDAGVAPYAYIRILADKNISLDGAEDISGQMNESYLRALVSDPHTYEDDNLYNATVAWLNEVREAHREARLNLAAGMRAFGLKGTA